MKIRFYIIILSILFGILGSVSEGAAELKIDSVYPTMGIKGQDLPITIRGSGFDTNTRVSMTIDAGNRKAIIGSVKVPNGDVKNVTLSDSLLYVAAGNAGLQIIDVSNPTNPKIIGSVKTSVSAEAIAVSGSIAYLTTIEYDDQFYVSLKVINVSNPSNPTIIGYVKLPGSYSRSVAVSGSIAYVAVWDAGLQVIDVSNPMNPTIIGTVDTKNLRNVFILKQIAYIGDGYELKI